MGSDFLLDTQVAVKLYESYANMRYIPVLDYHCHIDPKEIYEDRKYDNPAQLWLESDHYKWRQMRMDGIPEEYITGNAPDRDKFMMWARVLPKLIGNPLYHWSHMELRYYFGYEGILNADTAEEVWEHCSEMLASKDLSVRGIIRRSNVKLICTTDDPVDSLIWHEKIKEDDDFDVQVLPAFRPDRINGIEKDDFADYVRRLSEVSNVNVNDIATLKEALKKRIDFFERHGCRVSDHGMEYVCNVDADEAEVNKIFGMAMSGMSLKTEDILRYRTYMMKFLAGEYNKRGWVMQLHYGVRRDLNSKMYERIGANTGFDCIADDSPYSKLGDFLDELSRCDILPKTIIYSLDPNDDRMIGTITGCFSDEGVKSKIQHGSAWWFNDNLSGITEQMKSVASQSILGNFIGMLTDSRSFLSYVRHDYFRRILCRTVGRWVSDGMYPYDEDQLGRMIKGISYNNAVDYFGFDLEKV